MKNKTFILRSPEDKQKKLHAVLRSRTGNALNEDELRIMSLCVELDRQYEIVIHRDPVSFCMALVLQMTEEDKEQGRIVFGQAMFGWSTAKGLTLGRLFDENRRGRSHCSSGNGRYLCYPHLCTGCLSTGGGGTMSKDRRRNLTYDALVLLVLAAALSFITRLWPLLLLLILCLFLCGLRLLVLSSIKVEPLAAQPLPPLREPEPDNEGEVVRYAYRVLQVRITRELAAEFPNARWIWAVPDAARRFADGEELSILLNGAGGYRQASVRVHELRFAGLIWGTAPFTEQTSTAEATTPAEQPAYAASPDAAPEPLPVDYELLAFEWVEDHLLELNQQANEAVAQQKNTLMIPEAQLPAGESWLAICGELERGGFSQASCCSEGIEVTLPQ